MLTVTFTPQKHIHKYYWRGLTYCLVWACGIDGCSHYYPPHQQSYVENKPSICWECGEVFILTRDLMGVSKPVCKRCVSKIYEDAAETAHS